MASIKIIDNKNIFNLEVELKNKPFELIAMEPPFYIVINKQKPRIIFEYNYINPVSPINKIETNELKIYFGIHSGRIIKLDMAISDVTDNNWKYVLHIYKSRFAKSSNSLLNFSVGIEIAKVLRNKVITGYKKSCKYSL